MKIRIKKVTALLLSCMLLFSISGCQKKRTAKEVSVEKLLIRSQIVRLLHPQTLRSR